MKIPACVLKAIETELVRDASKSKKSIHAKSEEKEPSLSLSFHMKDFKSPPLLSL